MQVLRLDYIPPTITTILPLYISPTHPDFFSLSFFLSLYLFISLFHILHTLLTHGYINTNLYILLPSMYFLPFSSSHLLLCESASSLSSTLQSFPTSFFLPFLHPFLLHSSFTSSFLCSIPSSFLSSFFLPYILTSLPPAHSSFPSSSTLLLAVNSQPKPSSPSWLDHLQGIRLTSPVTSSFPLHHPPWHKSTSPSCL